MSNFKTTNLKNDYFSKPNFFIADLRKMKFDFKAEFISIRSKQQGSFKVGR